MSQLYDVTVESSFAPMFGWEKDKEWGNFNASGTKASQKKRLLKVQTIQHFNKSEGFLCQSFSSHFDDI